MYKILNLRQHFIDNGVEIKRPATQAEIDAFEAKYDVVLPDDLKQYFLLFNGTGECMFGDSGYAFFSLEEFKPILDESSPDEQREIYKDCFAFSDYLIWCWGYVIKLSKNPHDTPVFSIHLEKPPNHQVAKNFTEFVDMYLKNPNDVIGCP